MGTHRRKPGLEVIEFLSNLGNILNYNTQVEETMFPGSKDSPVLDLTWRRQPSARFPLFVFEVESTATKSATDNVFKVMSRKTPVYQKPLYFFHVIVEPGPSAREQNLTDSFDKDNYGLYSLYNYEGLKLISDIIDQHLRIDAHLDLYHIILQLNEQPFYNASPSSVLDYLIYREYDRIDGSNFLSSIEQLIAQGVTNPDHSFYVKYIKRWLGYSRQPWQEYENLIAAGYTEVLHCAILQSIEPNSDPKSMFQRILEIEKNYKPWELWYPAFGLSRDHDWVLLSEFPLILTLFCCGFAGSEYSKYFSSKLREIFKKINVVDDFTAHGVLWLLIASRIAGDRDSYNFARTLVPFQFS